jgi:hypothetical protein
VDPIGRRTEVAPHILEDLKQWIISKLKAGFIARQVFKEHKKVWFEDNDGVLDVSFTLGI